VLCHACRKTQDEFAAASHRKAAAAQAAGKFQAEIVPVHTKIKDPKSGSEQQVGFICLSAGFQLVVSSKVFVLCGWQEILLRVQGVLS
jgi:acetyl-CoA acyltransferase 1